MARGLSDRNLLFGALALEMRFISGDALVAAIRAWVGDKNRALGEILLERGDLERVDHDLIAQVVERHIQRHGGDAAECLSSVTLPPTARDSLGAIGDDDVQATLSWFGTTEADFRGDPDETALEPAPEDQSHGRYHILRHLKDGALGEVYIALDEELHREVALKRIKAKHADDPQRRARFMQEAEITGGLEHPGIVPVYGLGSASGGQPYYAMRFIERGELKAAIDRFHRAEVSRRQDGAREVELRRLLRCFLAVCDAIGYAHSRGVVHRDLKPSNIMLGRFGETLVVDWGLAKSVGRPEPALSAAEATLHPASGSDVNPTEMGSRVGTPAYMSPEQAAGRLDQIGPLSDLYSLGATLYYLLAGKPPFRDPNVVTVLRHVQFGDFPPPRALNPRVPRALEAICLKAMALSPEDRYETAGALADDIERWLADEPVTACFDPWTTRLARWSRRHKSFVSGAAALLVTAVVALSISTVVVSREQARKEEQRRLAVLNLRHAQDAADALLTEVGAVDLADVPQMEPVRRKLLEKARLSYQKFLNQREDDPVIRRGAGRAQVRLGEVLDMQGAYRDAEAAFHASLALLTRLTREDPANLDDRRELARAYGGLGSLLRKANRFSESERALGAAVPLYGSLAASPRGTADDRQRLAETRYQLAALLGRISGRRVEQERVFRDALDEQRALVAENRGEAEYRAKLGRYLNNLAKLLRATDPSASLAALEEAKAIQEALHDEAPALPGPRWQLARCLNNLAVLQIDFQRDVEGAEPLFLRARELLKALIDEFPRIPQYRRELAEIEQHLAFLAENNAHVEAADQAYERAEALWTALVTEAPEIPDHRQKRAVCLLHRNVLLARSQPDVAADALLQAIEEQERLVADYPHVAEYADALGVSLARLAWPFVTRGEIGKARDHLDRAIFFHEEALHTDPRNLSYQKNLFDDRNALARAFLKAGAPVEAARVLDRIERDLPELLDAYLRVAALWMQCATLAEATPGRADPVEAYVARALQILQAAEKKSLFESPDQLDRPDFQRLKTNKAFQDLRKRLGRSSG